MTRFRYRAVSGDGDLVRGELDAANRKEAARLLRRKVVSPSDSNCRACMAAAEPDCARAGMQAPAS